MAFFFQINGDRFALPGTFYLFIYLFSFLTYGVGNLVSLNIFSVIQMNQKTCFFFLRINYTLVSDLPSSRVIPQTRFTPRVLSDCDLCGPPLKPIILDNEDWDNLCVWFTHIWPTTSKGNVSVWLFTYTYARCNGYYI